MAVDRILVRNFGGSLYFPGAASYVDIGAVDLSINDTLTFSCWVKPAASNVNQGAIWGANNAANEFQVDLRTTDVKNGVSAFINGTIVSSCAGESYRPNEWCHIVITRNGSGASKIAYYVNNSSKSIFANNGSSFVSGAGNKYIGCRTTSTELFKGNISQVLIWNRVLSASEISNLYYSGTYSRTSLVGEWLLNEGSGTTATDTSGNSHNGSITGATWSTDAPTKLRT